MFRSKVDKLLTNFRPCAKMSEAAFRDSFYDSSVREFSSSVLYFADRNSLGVKVTVFWNVTSFILVACYHHCGESSAFIFRI